MKALSTRNDDPATASRPFDVDRDGYRWRRRGYLILESLEHATQRDAPSSRRLSAMECRRRVSHYSRWKWRRCVPRDARGSENAHLPDDILRECACFNAIGDVIETTTMKRLFGERAIAGKLPVARQNHDWTLLGGAGGLKQVSVLALRDQILPPTINQFHADRNAIWTTCQMWRAKRQWITRFQFV